MITYEIFAEIAPGQTRVGFFDKNGKIQDLWLCRDDQPDLIGSVHQVRIEQVFTSQNRACGKVFSNKPVSIKLPKNESLGITSGSIAVITIIAAPRHGKAWQAVFGARIVTPTVLLLPGRSGISLSRSLDKETLIKLKKLSINLTIPEGFGILLRRRATKLSQKKIQEVIESTAHDWKCRVFEIDPSEPGLLYDGGTLCQRSLRAVVAASYHECGVGPAKSLEIDEAVFEAAQTEVFLPSGGKMWFERSHALWSIDIDGADANIHKYGFHKLICEAAIEIARQIKIRGMTGIIMIDVPAFGVNLKKFIKQLNTCFEEDYGNPKILGITRGGMVELWRPHGRISLNESMDDYVAQAALCGLRLAVVQPAFKPVHIAVNKEIAMWLGGAGSEAVKKMERPLKISLCLDNDPTAVPYVIDKVGLSK